MIIRPAQADDLPAVAEIIRAAMALYAQRAGLPVDGGGAPQVATLQESPEALRAAVLGGHTLLGVVDDRPVATVRLDFATEPGVCYLRRVAVHPQTQGKGLGHQLYQAARQRATDAGATRIRLWTAAHNAYSTRFYQKLGMTVVATDDTAGYPRLLFEDVLQPDGAGDL